MLRHITLALVLSVAAFAQNPATAKFPGAIATSRDMTVQKNRSAATLTSSVNNSTTIIPVSNGASFIVDQVLGADNEYMQVTAINGNNLSVTRGFAGSTAEPHSNGARIYSPVIDIAHNQAAAEIAAIETALGVGLVNVVGRINGLTEKATPDAAQDYVAVWDTAGAGHRKVLLNKIGGLPVANQSECEGGMVNDRTATPLCVAQAVAVQTFMPGLGIAIDSVGASKRISYDPLVVVDVDTQQTISGNKKFVGQMDMSGATLQRDREAASDPTSCVKGETYWNTTTGNKRRCIGTSVWVDEGGTPSNSNSVVVVHKESRIAISSADTTPAIKYTRSIPSLGAGKCLRVTATAIGPEAAGVVYSRVTFGNSSMPIQPSKSEAGGRSAHTVATMCNAAGVQNSQDISYSLSTYGDTTASIDTSVSFDVQLWLSSDAPSSLTLKQVIIEELP